MTEGTGPFRLDGKVALITGAARGQGEAEARLFADAGARVVLTDVLVDEGKATAASIGYNALFLEHDVADEDSWQSVVDATVAELGQLNVVVNNAAIWRTQFIEQQSVEEFELVLRINLIGVFLGMRTAIAPMRAAGGGSIVNISSAAGMAGIPRHGAYGSAKWAVRGITKTAAIELGADGIRVNSVHPGVIDTQMISTLGVKRGQGNWPGVPLQHVGIPEDVANLV